MAELAHTFHDLFVRQGEFQKLVGDDPEQMTNVDKRDRMLQLVALQAGQSADMLKEIGYETHRPFAPARWDNAKVEWVDAFKYLLAQAVVAGWTPEELLSVFQDKSDSVHDRFIRERAIDDEAPVAVFDMDGVIVKFESYYSQEAMANGALRSSDPLPTTIDFLPRIRAAGIKVVICTARKAEQYRRIELDTDAWLRQYEVEYDLLIYAHDKYEAVKDFNVLFAVEDSAKHALDYATSADIPVFLVPSQDPDNYVPDHPRISKVSKIEFLPLQIHRFMQARGVTL